MKPFRTPELMILVLLAVIVLSGCHMPYRARVEVQITNFSEGQSVVLGEETRIISIADTSQGVRSIQLFINGSLQHTATPPEGNPLIYTADQPWTPEQEGLAQVAVIVLDAKGNLSDPFNINLQVVPSISQTDKTATPEPTSTPEGLPQTQTAQAGCLNDATFIQDITIPANAFLSPNTNFTKIWRVNNSGTCDWAGYHIVHISGELFGANPTQALPSVSADKDANISIDMVSPSTPGTYTSAWKIKSPDGTLFGSELTLLIVVPEPTDTPVPTPTRTPKPTKTPTPTWTQTLTPTKSFTSTPTRTATIPPLSVKQVDQQIAIEANSSGNLTVNCPAGALVTSGGFAAQSGLRVWHSMKDGNGWRVYATNKLDEPQNLTVFATCLSNSGGTVSQTVFQANAEPETITHLSAACPANSLVTGGGFVIGTNNSIQLYNTTKNENGWQIYIDNTSDSTPLINVYAICLEAVSGSTTSYQNTSGKIAPSGVAVLSQICPDTAYVMGGGFVINRGALVYSTFKFQNGWINAARNLTGEEKLFYTSAICYSP